MKSKALDAYSKDDLVDELERRGIFVFTAVPDVDFDPKEFNHDDVLEGLNIAFSECEGVI